MAGEEAEACWEAVVARDWPTAHEIARAVVDRILHEAASLAEWGQWLAPTARRLEAWSIERGELAPFPKPEQLPHSGGRP